MGAIMPLYLGYLTLINVLTLAAFVIDKRAAEQDAWRTSESRLLSLLIVGGVIGGWIAIYFLRHKSRHAIFWMVLWLATVLHALLVWWVFTNP